MLYTQGACSGRDFGGLFNYLARIAPRVREHFLTHVKHMKKPLAGTSLPEA